MVDFAIEKLPRWNDLSARLSDLTNGIQETNGPNLMF